jgi:hypothetical protein
MSVVDKYFEHLPALHLPRPPSRHFKRWHMPALPNNGVAHVASVIFPSRFLRTGTPAKLTKPVHWFPAPDQGALEVGFFYGRVRATYESPKAAGLGVKFFATLSDGRVFTVVARHTEFAEKQILDQCFREHRVYAFDPELWKLAPGERLKDLDMFPWSDVKDGEAIAVWAITGVDVRRDR